MHLKRSKQSFFSFDFVEIQRNSFLTFLEKGIIYEFQKRNPITDSEQELELIFYPTDYQLTIPKNTPKEALLGSKTYDSQLYIPAHFIDLQSKKMKLQWVLLGNIPLMTKRGHFIINGSPRVIVHQMVRSPGIYFKEVVDFKKNSTYYADFIPFRGTWIRLDIDKKQKFWVRMKKTPKIQLFVFLQALGLDYHQILNSLNNSRLLVTYLRFLDREKEEKKKDPVLDLSAQNTNHALELIYSRVYPKKQVSLVKGRKFLFRRFMNKRNYDLGEVGRTQLNEKLGLNKRDRTLTARDFLAATDSLLKLAEGFILSDDIDDLKNRRVRTSGELLQNQLGTGLVRLEKVIRERMTKPKQTLTLKGLITTKALNGALREFFGSSPLSQYMDQTNPLAEVTHKRKLSSLGPGGISRETAGMAVRGIHPTHFGRICPIETPEGKNAGLVNSLTNFSRINTLGFLETPLFQVFKGQVQKSKGPAFFSSEQEKKVKVAPGDLGFSSSCFLPENTLPIRHDQEFQRVNRNEVEFIAMSSIQMISPATSLIPFLEHNDANRALMGSNMQRQAVPILIPERPIVGTGLEAQITADSGQILQATASGFVSYVSGQYIKVESTFSFVNTQENKPYTRDRPNLKKDFQVEKFFSPQKSIFQVFLEKKAAFQLKLKNQSANLKETFYQKNKTTFSDAFCCHTTELFVFQAYTERHQNKKILWKTQLRCQKVKKIINTSNPIDGKVIQNCLTTQPVQKPHQEKLKSFFLFPKLYNEPVDSKKTQKFKTLEYGLQGYQRSNQDTSLRQRPAVNEGDWVQKGDLLADCTSSVGGELAVGKNVLIAYMPWEGYNFEDAILISERLVFDEVYTSIHIERYVLEVRDTQYGMERITRLLPEITAREIKHLDPMGFAKEGSWVCQGDVLVGKITPIKKKILSAEEKLVYDILFKDIPITRDTSLRVPKGVQGRVIHVKILENETFYSNEMHLRNNELKREKFGFFLPNKEVEQTTPTLKESETFIPANVELNSKVPAAESIIDQFQREKVLQGPTKVHVFLAEKRNIQRGDKLSGRHGNKGIVSQILSRQDMPYLPDGTPLDMVLNPLGVPSRMNVGQVFESLLGLAGRHLGQQFKIAPFDEANGPEASRALVYSKLFKARLKTGKSWLFNPEFPGKTKLFDGRTGFCFDQPVTVGQAYMLKLIHLVDEKIHARSTGPYSLITQQPLRGKSKHGGQRFGEMEVWALEGFGAAYTLQELLTFKSDDVRGRHQVMEAFLDKKTLSWNASEAFKVLVKELQSLCLNVTIYGNYPNIGRKTMDVMEPFEIYEYFLELERSSKSLKSLSKRLAQLKNKV